MLTEKHPDARLMPMRLLKPRKFMQSFSPTMLTVILAFLSIDHIAVIRPLSSTRRALQRLLSSIKRAMQKLLSIWRMMYSPLSRKRKTMQVQTLLVQSYVQTDRGNSVISPKLAAS